VFLNVVAACGTHSAPVLFGSQFFFLAFSVCVFLVLSVCLFLSLSVYVFLIVCLPQCCVSISSVCVYLRMFVSLSQCV